jgi:hypothetical protein
MARHEDERSRGRRTPNETATRHSRAISDPAFPRLIHEGTSQQDFVSASDELGDSLLHHPRRELNPFALSFGPAER